MGEVGFVVLAERMPPGVAGLAVNDGGGAVGDGDVLIVGASQPACALDRPAERSLVDFCRRRRRGIATRVPAAAQPTSFGAAVPQRQNVRADVSVPAPEEVAFARDVLGAAQIAGAAAVIGIVGAFGGGIGGGGDGGGSQRKDGSGRGGSGSAERAGGGPCICSEPPPLALGGRAGTTCTSEFRHYRHSSNKYEDHESLVAAFLFL